MSAESLIASADQAIFSHRRLVIGIFTLITLLMLYSAVTGLRVDAGFTKQLPLEHEYMQTFVKHQQAFGGANRVLIALLARDGDMFTPEFFEALEIATKEVRSISGVDQSRVSSLFTPDVRFTEVVEDGIDAGNVVPADFQPTPESLAQVRENILKAGIVGRFVANDFSGAIVSAQLLEADPSTGEAVNPIRVAQDLEAMVRNRIGSGAVAVEAAAAGTGVDVHMIGFAKIVGDIYDGALRVVLFFLIAFGVTALLVYMYSQSLKVTIIPLICSLAAVIWQLGALTMLGFGIDPMGILVPFLIFAIGVSHGVQMISSVGSDVVRGQSSYDAARSSFRRLCIPGSIALASDTIGFITILLINIRVIQEMAITASLGVAAIIFTNLVLLPVLVSYVRVDDVYRDRLLDRAAQLAPLWNGLAKATRPRIAGGIILASLALMFFGLWKGSQIKIGDFHSGVPELRADSRYNLDSAIITDRFSIGVDIISVIVETIPDGCIEHEVINAVDRFAWHMRNVPGVQSVVSLPGIMKVVSAGWNEGSMKWRVLSRNSSVLVQAQSYVPTSTGLLNADCSVMPVMLFTTDHKAETIDTVVNEVKQYRAEHDTEKVKFKLATGNVGVMAATNEEVDAAQFPILFGVFLAIILLCWLTFRSFRAVLCIVLPLALVSLLAYALMTVLEIGLKVSTLPVVALGVGIGVDYGIYIFSRFQGFLKNGQSIHDAYLNTLTVTGYGVVFTGITLAIGVATWIFSPLKFQADMGILLTFMFLVNMLGAILLLPALASWLFPASHRATNAPYRS